MIKKLIIVAFVVFAILAIFGKKDSIAPSENNISDIQVREPSQKSRSFYMGFSTWPPDFDFAAIDKALALSGAESDIRLLHFDGGVPWVEMDEGRAVPKRIREYWSYIKERSGGKKIFIAITPLDFDRINLALYASEKDDNQPLPEQWKNLQLDDDRAKRAYLAYARAMVEYWRPEYLAIGIEVNIALNKSKEHWDRYRVLHEYVYTELKKDYPTLPIFATVQLEHFMGTADGSEGKFSLQKAEVAKLMPYEDILALSAYPYAKKGGGTFTTEDFSEIKKFGKQLAIAETGWPSKSTTVFGAKLAGSEGAQAQFIGDLLEAANKDKFAFVINWVNVDYDKLLSKLPRGTIAEFSKFWVYNGLWDQQYKEKPALKAWRGFLNLPRK